MTMDRAKSYFGLKFGKGFPKYSTQILTLKSFVSLIMYTFYERNICNKLSTFTGLFTAYLVNYSDDTSQYKQRYNHGDHGDKL